MTEPTAMSARPVRTARIANASAAFALVVFIVVALLMRRDNAGAYFGHTDQVFTVIIGLIVAGGLRLPARPRMTADLESVRTRGYLGDWRTIPWAAIVAVEFPSNVRFARLRLPGEETLAVYAIQRMDREYAVAAMRDLRALFAASRAAA
ncbi:PH domain-containing protein [uncultured Jatrophihabitans sp.]|uniref:PH domain-containing protein n=1 Tax=uncultured Jatrophihabitans sp. TaxID=1610747 RepID=UPI0035CB6F62